MGEKERGGGRGREREAAGGQGRTKPLNDRGSTRKHIHTAGVTQCIDVQHVASDMFVFFSNLLKF